MESVVSGVGVLDKAMHLLDVVEYSQPVSFLDLVEAVGFPKTTVHRLVAALEMHGFLRRDDSGRLVTGSRFATASLSQLATPIMARLTRATGESTQLFVRRGQLRLCIVSIESPAELRTAVPVGTMFPIDKGSGGKVLLGSDQVLDRGWAQSAGERSPGVASVSAPVYEGSVVVAALCLSGPIERLARNRASGTRRRWWPRQRRSSAPPPPATDRLTAPHRSPGGRPPRPSRRSCSARPGRRSRRRPPACPPPRTAPAPRRRPRRRSRAAAPRS
jgi:DNA-binding IclR family transcriptional regulator